MSPFSECAKAAPAALARNQPPSPRSLSRATRARTEKTTRYEPRPRVGYKGEKRLGISLREIGPGLLRGPHCGHNDVPGVEPLTGTFLGEQCQQAQG